MNGGLYMKYPEARIAICKCAEGRKTYGVRFEEYENDWKATWAFPIKKAGAEKRENYENTKIEGNIRIDKDYPGCPYCKGIGFIVCDCGGLNCNTASDSPIFTCGWCGMTGELTGYDGSGVNAGGDR